MPGVEEIDQRLLPIYEALSRRDLVGLQRQIAPEIVLHGSRFGSSRTRIGPRSLPVTTALLGGGAAT